MKDKVLTGINGVLIGMIVATLLWGVYIKNVGFNSNNINNNMFDNRFSSEGPNINMERPEMPEGGRENLAAPTRYSNSNM